MTMKVGENPNLKAYEFGWRFRIQITGAPAEFKVTRMAAVQRGLGLRAAGYRFHILSITPEGDLVE